MFGWLKRRPAPPAAPLPAVPDGQRVYAIGDVHGCLALLDELLDLIEADDAARGAASTTIILLGDLIDRGSASAQVIERVIGLVGEGWPIRAIMGNHEEVLLGALAGDPDQLRLLLRIGGVPTIESYGVTVERLEEEVSEEDGLALVAAAVPDRHKAFLETMETQIRIGDYLFVHAGVRPGVTFEEQSPQDLRWIRKEFLGHKEDLGATVVHGHSIRTNPDFRSNRLGIDTGAYRTGRLTAIGLEGTVRWVLQTQPPPGAEDQTPA